MTERLQADVIVVGAGVAGALIADALARAGREVLILDGGTGDELDPDAWLRAVRQMYRALWKVPNAPFHRPAALPSPDLTDVFLGPGGRPDPNGYFVQRGPLPFASDYLRATGGTTLHWLGSCPRMLPADFEMRRRYGVGVDWPVGYDDLAPWYVEAERALGVAADVDDQRRDGAHFPDGYVYPMHAIPPSWLDGRLARALDGARVSVDGAEHPLRVVSTPQARNGVPNPRYDQGRGYQPVGLGDLARRGERCVGSASCVPICPVQARYSALRTLRALPSTARMVHRAVVTRVGFDRANGRITHVEGARYGADGATPAGRFEARGAAFVLACNAIENATLLLDSGAAPGSDALGRHLMDHPYVLTAALHPENLGVFRGPSATSHVAGLRDGAFRRHTAGCLVEIENWGWHVATGAPHAQVEAMIDAGLWGEALRARVADEVPRQLGLGALVEQLPEASNRVTVDPSLRTPLGGARPVINYDLSAYTRAGLLLALRASRAVFAAAGAEDRTRYRPDDPRYLEHEGVGVAYRGGGHVAGTHRMSSSPDDGVVDAQQRAWAHDNLYVVGCGSMPTMGTSNPTLTLAALCLRTARHLTERLA